jgi:hypothetical protein
MTKEQAIKLLRKETSPMEIHLLTIEGLNKEEVTDKIQEACDMGADAIEKLTWISVKDRLPEEPEIGVDGYIVQKKNICEPFSAYWDGYKWTDDYDEIQEGVIAWMPLPKPYKETL